MELSPRLYNWFVRPGWFSDLYIRHLIYNSFDFSNKVLLDFGCGTGVNCLLGAPDYYLGVDSDSKRIEYAKRLYPDYCFKTVKTYPIPITERSVDYILIVSVLHHIPPTELQEYLKEFSRILKSKGKILILEPCFFDNTPMGNFAMKFMDRGKYIQSEDQYLNLLNQCGYEVEVLDKYRQLLVYNKLFIKASLKV